MDLFCCYPAPGYNAWRRSCGLSQPRNQAELGQVLNNTNLARRLLELYGTPENIDVWMGGVAEPFVPGGRVGPLFACLIARQFKNVRDGDRSVYQWISLRMFLFDSLLYLPVLPVCCETFRLWYQNPGFFTARQRAALGSASLSRIICDNTGITIIPANPFDVISNRNRLVRCNNIRNLDLSAWTESPRKSPGCSG